MVFEDLSLQTRDEIVLTTPLDYNFRQSLTPVAREACAIVDTIRFEEQAQIWTPSLEADLASQTNTNIYPGMIFSGAKSLMESTRLWKIVRKMPKGALLHAHCDAMVDFDFLLDCALSTKGMCISCEKSLENKSTWSMAPLRFQWRKKEDETSSLWDAAYTPHAWIPIQKAADTFPGGSKAFIQYVKDRMTITHLEHLDSHQGTDAAWRKFESIFPIVDGIVMYEPIFRKFMQRMMKLSLEDGVRWIDLRLAMGGHYYRANREEPDADRMEFFKHFGEEIEKFKNSEEGKGFWGCRMIWTGIRRMDTRGIVEDMDHAIMVKMAYPHLISGYDLVGQEDAGRPLKDVLPELFWFRKQCAQEKIEMPFFFHAGETLGDGTDVDENLFDAILLGTRRIGHGFSLYKHPLLIDMVKEKKILVESCPISNEVLRLTASIASHPLPALLSRGVACSLCNDDPAILGQDTAGMTHDFWQALQGWDNLGLAGLGSLAENSVRYAAFEDETQGEWLKSIKDASLGNTVRANRLKEWEIEWERFCLWIVQEYGPDAESLRIIRGEESIHDEQD